MKVFKEWGGLYHQLRTFGSFVNSRYLQILKNIDCAPKTFRVLILRESKPARISVLIRRPRPLLQVRHSLKKK